MTDYTDEDEFQIAVNDYCELIGLPMIHIPNEGKRSVYAGALLKRKGLKKGVPDCFFPIPFDKYHGAFIELKVGKNKPTIEQKRWLEYLSRNGYFCAVCRTFDNFQAIVDKIKELSGKVKFDEA